MKSDKITKYIITDGEQYVSNTTGTSFKKSKEEAYLWTSKEAAENVLNTHLGAHKGTIAESNTDFRVEPVNIYSSDIDGDVRMDIDTIEQFNDIVRDAAEHEDDLRTLQSTTDRTISDILHYIEQNDLNGVDGYRIYKKLQLYLKQRRTIKNRLHIASVINSQCIDPEVLKHLVAAYRQVYYKPREVDFENILE